MAWTLTIAGVDQSAKLQPDWEIEASANNRRAFRFSILSDDGTYRPAYDDEVLLTDPDGNIVFAGLVMTPEEAGAVGGQSPILTTVTAQDYNILAARRFVLETIAAGTLKAALEVIIAYLPGVTLDPAQVDGPDLPDLSYDDMKAEDVLNDLTAQSGGYLWEIYYDSGTLYLRMVEPSTVAAPFAILESDSEAVEDVIVKPTREGYANRVIVRAGTARALEEDAADIVARGPYEFVYKAPDNTPDDALTNLAQALLARSLIVRKTVTYNTWRRGLVVGQTQTINLPSRAVNNLFLITELRMSPIGPDTINHQVSAIEGVVLQPGWRDAYKQWSGGGTSIPGIGGGVGVVFVQVPYFLGGTGQDFVQSPDPDWVPASPIQVQINTVPRGTTAATIVARLRVLEAGTGVTARLYDVSAAAACPGVSPSVTSTSWQLVSWGVTLTAGSHLYELQLLPSHANKDVGAVGAHLN